MKIATYNIQNLFHRDKSLNDKSYSKCMTDWINELDDLMRGNNRATNHKERIQELVFLLGFDKTLQAPYAVLRRKAGFLYLKGKEYSKELCANEMTDWNGWITLQTTPIDSVAVKNKARVITDVNPDILLLQEIEDRASLEEFNAQLLPEFDCEPFQEIAVVQGSDKRGQEMGLLLKNGHRIKSISTHQFDIDNSQNPKKEFFQYEIETNTKQTIILLAAQLQKETDDKKLTDAYRKLQAQQIADAYQKLIKDGYKSIIIAGTLNAVSYCDSLSPLLRKTDLKDVTKHQKFNVDFDEGSDADYFRLGAYRLGVNIKQRDYLLLSPDLFAQAKQCGLNRKGILPKERPIWKVYPDMPSKKQAASEHPLVWVGL